MFIPMTMIIGNVCFVVVVVVIIIIIIIIVVVVSVFSTVEG